MSPFQGLLCFIVCFFLPNVLYLLIGSLLVKTCRFHRLGVRLLALSMLVSARRIACKCHQHCEDVRCRIWNCENYHRVKK